MLLTMGEPYFHQPEMVMEIPCHMTVKSPDPTPAGAAQRISGSSIKPLMSVENASLLMLRLLCAGSTPIYTHTCVHAHTNSLSHTQTNIYTAWEGVERATRCLFLAHEHLEVLEV